MIRSWKHWGGVRLSTGVRKHRGHIFPFSKTELTEKQLLLCRRPRWVDRCELTALEVVTFVTALGNERRDIYRDEADQLKFLESVPAQSERFGLRPWRYVLMDNHCHQGLETTEPNLSRAMEWQCELQRLVQATVPSCRTSIFRDASRRCCGSGGNGDWSSRATCIPSEI